MRNFESFLSPRFNEFVAYRKAMGYAIEHSINSLRLFDRYLMDKGADWDSLTPLLFFFR